MDFVESFLAWTKHLPSSEIFKLWSAIACISGALERRVWSPAPVESGQLFPNVYVMLVGGPGTGKNTAIKPTEALWRGTEGLCVSPSSMTGAALCDALDEASRILLRGNEIVAEWHGMVICVPEFIVLSPKYDPELMGRLSDIYDAPEVLHIRRRNVGSTTNTPYPFLTILAGAQPSMLRAVFPEEIWGQGITSRLLMVYSDAVAKTDLFIRRGLDPALRAQLGDHLRGLMALHGEFVWDPDAARELSQWHLAGGPPTPTHTKLQQYNMRRTSMHALKLCMVASASRGTDMRITMDDVERALGWLLGAEATMPEIFRAMHGTNDSELIRELHYWAWTTYSKDHKPMSDARAIQFLTNRTTVDKAKRLFDLMFAIDKFQHMGSFQFKPMPTNSAVIE